MNRQAIKMTFEDVGLSKRLVMFQKLVLWLKRKRRILSLSCLWEHRV